MFSIVQYINKVCISFSIMLNVILGGSLNQTLSATQWDRKRNNKLNIVWLIDSFFFWQKNHCLEAWIKWNIIQQAIGRYHDIGQIFYEKNKKKINNFFL